MYKVSLLLLGRFLFVLFLGIGTVYRLGIECTILWIVFALAYFFEREKVI